MIMKKKRRWLRWTVDLAVIALVFFAINAWSSRDAVHGVAPDINGELLDGTPVSLKELRGKPVLVHFWATWCGICGLEQSTIDALAKEYTVLTVAIDDALPGRVLIYMKEKGVNYPVIHDPDYSIAHDYGVRGVPSSFILDADGNIRFVETGYTSGTGLRLRLWWVGRDV
jgi:thiol-disulfide isomerase/thioredoxin